MMYVFPFDIQIEGLHVENCSKKKKLWQIYVKVKGNKKRAKETQKY